jgi:branched-chain amino acid transport system permease protein
MRKNSLYAAIFFCFLLELTFPLVISDFWTLRIIMFANIFVIFAVSSDLLFGYTGLVTFGQSLFFGGAGYVAGLLSLNFGLPLIVCMIAGCIFALLAGILIGYICLRLKGPYLGVTTLIAPLVLMTVLHLSPTYLGGDNGIAGFAQLAGGSGRWQFYIVLLLTLGSVFITLILAQGNLGLRLKTIREDEAGAEAAGINTTKYKVIAFAYSGLFGGLAGTLYVHIMGSVAPTTLSPHYAMFPIYMIYLGGASSIVGPAIGAYVVTFLDLYLLAFPYLRVAIYAVVIIIVLRFLPGGFMAIPSEIRRFKLWRSLRSQASRNISAG